MKRFLLLTVLLMAVTIAAQDAPPADYPTLAALDAAVIPPRDLLELAERFNGVTEVSAPPINPAPLTVGTTQMFWAENSQDNLSFQVEAELRVVGEHIYLWVEKGAELPQDGLQQLADAFDATVYDSVRDLWGSEPVPGVDGDPRVHGLFASNLGGGIGAYYATKHAYPVEAVPSSNAKEMFFYNLDTVGWAVGNPLLTSITAHEFQHMIRANVDSNEDGWLDEGFSEFTQLYLGDFDQNAVMAFLNMPHTQLNMWSEDYAARSADYGKGLLWVTYLYERFGVEGLRQLSADAANGLVGVNHLAASYGTDGDTVFADWVIANWIQDPARSSDARYGYTSFSGLPAPFYRSLTLPANGDVTLPPYSTAYYVAELPQNATRAIVTFNTPVEHPLIGTASPSGTPMWYSQRGDDSDMHLTIPLDLRGMSAPLLSYDLWFHAEELWDYGYVMVSRDGQTWDLLQTPAMTTENPYFNAYGAGYSGRSGGGETPAWIHEVAPLSAYAGENVLLRFEMIYDDAVNQSGMALDQITLTDLASGVSTINRFDDPLTMADWQAAGWVLTDNRLPLGVWVQLLVEQDGVYTLHRWQEEGGAATFSVDLPQGAERIVLSLAPFAPMSMVPANLTWGLTVE
jgi:hypothetical protein